MKKNALVIIIALVICAGLLIVGMVLNKAGVAPGETVPLDTALIVQSTPTAAPSGETIAAPTVTAAAEPTAAPSAAPDAAGDISAAKTPATAPVSIFEQRKPEQLYLVVAVDGKAYEPIPLTGEDEYTIDQKEINASNTIHVTKDSVYMAASTCTNQDCVKQGTVSRENRNSRVLGNMVICLPNKVSLQLCTAEEIAQMLQ